MLTSLLLLSVHVHAADVEAPDPAWDLHDFEVLREFRISELGIEPVFEDDGESYHYEGPSDLETPDIVQRGALFYAYDGQQVYGVAATPEHESSYVRPEYHLTDVSHDAGAYLGVGETVTVDEYGRRWLLVGYDEAAMWDALDAYDALVERTQGLGEEPQERVGIEYDPLAGVRETEVLDTDLWVTFECDGDAGLEVEDHIYGGTTDGLSVYGAPNVRQKKVLFLLGATGTVLWRGSAVLVDDDTVLTAAHNIADSTGYLDQVNMRLCSYGNVYTGAQCRSVSSLSAPGGVYDGTTANDYAVITLSSAYSPTIGWMAMSTASDATIEASTHYHEGFIHWRPTCDNNWTSDDADTVVDGSYTGIDYSVSPPVFRSYAYSGSWLMSAYGPAREALTGSIRFNVSSGSGMSGSPYYYCPSGCTATSGSHFVTAITHSHHITSSTDGYTNGAKARDFRDWVILHM